MKINPAKLNTQLPSNLEPFGYIEETKKIDMEKCGGLMLISFGAMNYQGHFAPEFGGIALVHVKESIFIAVKYIPWNAQAREKELNIQFEFLKENQQTITPQELTDYFNMECGYVFPSKKQRLREEYIDGVAEANRERAIMLKKKLEEKQKMFQTSLKDCDVIKVQESPIRKKQLEERKEKEKQLKEKKEKELEERAKKEKNLYKGEELIPLDDKEEDKND